MWLRPVKFYQPKVPGDTLSAAPHDPSPLGNGLKTALLWHSNLNGQNGFEWNMEHKVYVQYIKGALLT